MSIFKETHWKAMILNPSKDFYDCIYDNTNVFNYDHLKGFSLFYQIINLSQSCLKNQFYELQMQVKPNQSYAPFGSVVSKKQKKKNNQIQSPGPGSYDVNLPIITPIVQTIRKRNNNIIVKLGHIGTSSFLGNNQRFSKNNKNSLGPGQYHKENSQQKHKEDKKINRKYAAVRLKQIIHSPFERQPSISQIKKIDFDDQVQMPDKSDLLKSRQKEHNYGKGCAWSKMTQERIKSPSDTKQRLGPGSYNLENSPKSKSLRKQPSSAFVSKGVRSFFDQIRFQTNHDEKARSREQKNYKSSLVGPGSYEVSPKRRRSLNYYQFFGSTQQRF